MSTLKPAPSPGIKMPQTYNMDPKQLAAKYNKPNVPATLKPMLPSETTTDAKLPFAIGTEVVIKVVLNT